MIRVLIADDHTIVREGLKRILADAPDVTGVAEAADGRQALARIREGEYDVLLLDIAMPGMDGVDVLKQVKQEKPKIAVLVLSMYPEDQYATRMLKAGAAGYLTKDRAPEELLAAIRRVAGGGRYITESIAERLAIDLKRDAGDCPPHELLSDREYQVLRAIASGKQVSQIADELTLSVKTISTYRTRILNKLGLNTNAELMHYAMHNKLVEPL